MPMRESAKGLSIRWNRPHMGHPGTRETSNQARRTPPRRGVTSQGPGDRLRAAPWVSVEDVSPYQEDGVPVFARVETGWHGAQVHAALRREGRVRAGRDPDPRAAMLDRPSLTPVRGDAGGDDGANNMRGRTQHLLEDVLG